MTDILNIGGEPIYDERIVKFETHTYNPYANTTLGNSDEIRIPIQQQDLYTLPCQSFLYVEGKLTAAAKAKEDDAPTVTLVPNCVAFMFDELRYELDGVEIDRSRNVGITSTIKNYVSLSSHRNARLQNASWDLTGVTLQTRDFNFCVPLSLLLGFCEDYKRIVINARHELVLIRSRSDTNCIIVPAATTQATIKLLKVQWRMPHVTLSEINKLSLLRTLESGRYLSMSFRSWDLYEFPLLQSTTQHSWAVKTAMQLEKPRYVILALQTNKKNVPAADVTRFDHCKLTNAKLYLNSECYPYDDMNLDFDKGRFAILYEMYARFQETYYGYDRDEAYLNLDKFLYFSPIVVIDCSRQNDSVKSAPVDVRIEFDCKENIAPNTTAYCLIIHDRVVEYSPLTSVVRRIV